MFIDFDLAKHAYIPRHKGHKWLNRIWKLMFIEADSYTIVIYHVTSNKQLNNIWVVTSMLCIYIYITYIYTYILYIYIYIYIYVYIYMYIKFN